MFLKCLGEALETEFSEFLQGRVNEHSGPQASSGAVEGVGRMA